MRAILEITFPFFALIAAGYVCVWRTWTPVPAVRALNQFVLFIALPCMLFKFGAGLEVATLGQQPFLPIYGFVGIVLYAVLAAIGRMQDMRWKDLSFVSLAAVFPNTGFMGVPLVVSMLGTRAATPAVAIVLFDMVATTSLSVATSTLDGHDWSRAGRAFRHALAGVASNPMLWSILAGMAFAVAHVAPGPTWRQPIWMMADAATPVALFAIGGILARPRVEPPALEHRHPIAAFVAAKLVVHPLLMWLAVSLASRAGLSLDPWVRQTLVLMAALPSASNVSFLAERMGGSAAWVARVILWTTAGAFATFTAWAWWLEPVP